MSDPVKSSIPKFASFRPKGPATESSRADSSKELEEQTPRKRDRSLERAHRVDRSTKSRRAKGPTYTFQAEQVDRPQSDGIDRREHGRARTADHDLTTLVNRQDEYFQVDCKGDVQNLQYGKLHRYSIPPYRRSGNGFILGLARTDRIERTNDDQLIVGKAHSAQRERPNYASQKWQETRGIRLIRAEAAAHDLDPNKDYISAINPRARRTMHSGQVDQLRDMTGDDLLGRIEDPGSEVPEFDVEYESDTSHGSSDDRYNNEIKSENARLTRQITTDPTNVAAWRALIEHQSAVLSIGRAGRPYDLTANEERAVADVRSTIYEQAIKVVPDGNSRLDLIIEHMDEVATVWESKRLWERWKALLKHYPQSIKLWLRYLQVVQTSFTEYRFESCKAIYQKCFEILSHMSHSRDASAFHAEHVQRTFVYLLTRYTFMIREAGYSELAIALWQATLEFALLRPANLQAASTSDALNAFEEFWESEAARIGEVDALGWLKYDASAKIPSPRLRELIQTAGGSALDGWAQLESSGQGSLHYPGRTCDELGADDPYHIVLYSDLRSVLATIPEHLEPHRLVQGYLWFAGLPQLVDGDTELVNMIATDAALQNHTVDAIQNIECVLKQSRTVQTSALLFGESSTDQLNSTEFQWAHRTLELLGRASPDNTRLAEAYLALSMHRKITNLSSIKVTKMAKSILKARPTSLRLYNAYGIIEARDKNPKFHNIFATALRMSKSFAEDDRWDEILLWRTWTVEVMATGDTHLASQILNSIGRGNLELPSIATVDPGPESMLRSSKLLIELRDQAISTGRMSHAALAVECLSLLHYLQPKDQALEPALAIYRQGELSFQERALASAHAIEALHQARAGLLTWHMDHARSYRPTVIREAMAESVKLFPSNTLLLAVFLRSEERFRIDNRVRTMVSNVVSSRGATPKESITMHFFAIAAEMRSMTLQTSTRYAVRAAFERAVNSRVGEHSPGLWQAYLRFELDAVSGSWESAKEIFLRGMSKLPWCKTFMMEAFKGQLKNNLSEEQLMRIYNVMEEKELRLFNSMHDA